jgi:hypothetical protein
MKLFPAYESQMSHSETTAPLVYLLAIPCGKNTRREFTVAAEYKLRKLIDFVFDDRLSYNRPGMG